MIEILVYLAAVLLTPLVPAFILYKLLPSRTSVSGPFKGLNIQLTGSFGGYFLLVLISISFTYVQQKQIQPVEYHYNLHFPRENFPDDMGKTQVTVKIRKHGKTNWREHNKYSTMDTGNGIMVTVKDVSPKDILYINAEYDDRKWESNSATVPVGHLEMTLGNSRELFR